MSVSLRNDIFVDVLNVVCERQDSLGKDTKFCYESLVETMKIIEQTYIENVFYCMPEYLSYNKRLNKIHDKNIRKFIEEQIKSKKIILTSNGKEKDDKTLLSIVMAMDGLILSKDKKMKNHLKNFSHEMRRAALEFIEKSIIDFHFINGKIAIVGLIPKKFMENT